MSGWGCRVYTNWSSPQPLPIRVGPGVSSCLPTLSSMMALVHVNSLSPFPSASLHLTFLLPIGERKPAYHSSLAPGPSCTALGPVRLYLPGLYRICHSYAYFGSVMTLDLQSLYHHHNCTVPRSSFSAWGLKEAQRSHRSFLKCTSSLSVPVYRVIFGAELGQIDSVFSRESLL